MIYSTLNDMDQSNVQASELYTLQLPSKQESITLLENLIEEIADKHKIEQPRGTRWDNDPNRPKTDEERRQRMLESKRRYILKLFVCPNLFDHI